MIYLVFTGFYKVKIRRKYNSYKRPIKYYIYLDKNNKNNNLPVGCLHGRLERLAVVLKRAFVTLTG